MAQLTDRPTCLSIWYLLFGLAKLSPKKVAKGTKRGIRRVNPNPGLLLVLFCTKRGRREPRQRHNCPPKGAQDRAPGAKWPTGWSLQHLLTLVEAFGVQKLVPRASTNTPAHHDVAQHFSVTGLASMGGQVAWDSLRPSEVWPSPQDPMWVAQRFLFICIKA